MSFSESLTLNYRPMSRFMAQGPKPSNNLASLGLLAKTTEEKNYASLVIHSVAAIQTPAFSTYLFYFD